jgi:type I restriction enzyme S subunit
MTANNQVAEVNVKYLAEVIGHAVPAGYKQTEVGMVPEDWEILTFGEVAKPKSMRVNPKSYGGGDYCIELEHIAQGKGILLGETQTNINSSLKSVFDEKDVLFGKLRAYLRKYWLANRQGVCSTEIWVLKTENSKTLPEFIYQTVQTDRFIEAASEAYGTHMPRADWKIVKDFRLPVPSKAEQTAIANALSDADALINELEKLIAKKQAIKTATMQQLLTGRTRLPQFALHKDSTPKGYKQSELGDIPEDWEVVEFWQFIKGVIDNRGKTPPLTTDGSPMVEVNAVFKQGKSPNLEKVTKYVSQQTYENWFRDGHPTIGDILVVTVGSAGETSFVDAEGFCIAQNLIGLKIKFGHDAEFIYYLTKSVSFRKQVEAVLMGAVQPSLKVPHLNKFAFVAPISREEQSAIATILSNMDEETQTLQQRLDKTRQIKQGMMQELLTGKTRLVKSAQKEHANA